MNSAMEELVRSLLYEGYALYPYTPGVKNATPTPFGIVYPPAYSETQPAAFSMLRLEAVLQGGPDARISGRVLFLQATGERTRGGRAVPGAGSGDPCSAGARSGARDLRLSDGWVA